MSMGMMRTVGTVHVRNVNRALHKFISVYNAWQKEELPAHTFRDISPRGRPTHEFNGVYVTEYSAPTERVLFGEVRDCNPFFHFFESLWILAGRSDVASLEFYNRRMREYSDDGLTFHGAYGYRLRFSHGIDQLERAVSILKRDNDTRQVVLSIWDPIADLGTKSKDIPCNDLIFLKVRDGRLNITVCCRSNDVVWGAYGANAVQFSMLQELIASCVGVEVGTYTQLSDSMHVYTDEPTWQRVRDHYSAGYSDYYSLEAVSPFPINPDNLSLGEWLEDCEAFMNGASYFRNNRFFSQVAVPLRIAFSLYRERKIEEAKDRVKQCAAEDWQRACYEWLDRRSAVR